MTNFDVILVPFPFVDRDASKRRPCLVLRSFRPRSMGEHLIVAMMTSQVGVPHFPFDVAVEDLSSAGLPKPTLVRLSKIVTIDASLAVKRLGALATPDRHTVKETFQKLFAGLCSH